MRREVSGLSAEELPGRPRFAGLQPYIGHSSTVPPNTTDRAASNRRLQG